MQPDTTRRADIAIRTEDGRTYAIDRLGSQRRSADAQVRYLDRAHRTIGAPVRRPPRRARLTAEPSQLQAGPTLNKQGHKVANRPSVESRVIAVNDRGDGIRRDRGILLLQPVDKLLNRRPFI